LVPINEATITIISQDRDRLIEIIVHVIDLVQGTEPNAMIDIHICPIEEEKTKNE